MNTPPNPPAPEALNLALSQITDVLKESGKERLADLANQKDGYSQIIWLLEKLSKASLDWREQQNGKQPLAEGQAGTSPTTEKQMEKILEQ